MMLSATSASEISLRYPSRVGSRFFSRKFLRTGDPNTAERVPEEDPMGFSDHSRWASYYFQYKKYPLIHLFFDSAEFLRLERRYPLLMELDVQSCFDSIYTHSIEWSLRGRDCAKAHLGQMKHTFEERFDGLMQDANWGETHGIVVGPEFSRIFAEIVLQSADRSICRSIVGDGRVVVRRYVDNYYIFGYSVSDLDATKSVIEKELRVLKLFLNEAKTKIHSRPFVAPQTIARRNTSRLISSFLDETSSVDFYRSPFASARLTRLRRRLISDLRHEVASNSVGFDSCSSHSLTVLGARLAHVLSCFEEEPPPDSSKAAILSFCLSVLDVAYFLFEMDKRVITSQKLWTAYGLVVNIAERVNVSRQVVNEAMLSGFRSAVVHSSSGSPDLISRLNMLYVVDLIHDGDSPLEPDEVYRCLGVGSDGDFSRASYFELMTGLLVSRDRGKFRGLRDAVTREIMRRISSHDFAPATDCEDALLLVDFVSCPYVDEEKKIAAVRSASRSVTGQELGASARRVASACSALSFVKWKASSASLAALLAKKALTAPYE